MSGAYCSRGWTVRRKKEALEIIGEHFIVQVARGGLWPSILIQIALGCIRIFKDNCRVATIVVWLALTCLHCWRGPEGGPVRAYDRMDRSHDLSI